MDATAAHLLESVAGLHPAVQLLAAIVGVLSALAVAIRAGAGRRRAASRRGAAGRRSQKVLVEVDEFGVPVATCSARS